MSNINWLLIFSVLILFQACKSSQPAKPQEYYDNLNLEPEPSTLNIPIRIYRNELEQSINRQLGEVLFDDNNLADDGMMIKATRRENISLVIDNQLIKYKVPVKLWVKKDLGFTDVEAEGAIALTFSTRYLIKPDWSFETTTELSEYSWLKEPILKMGFANFPVTSIANILLNNTKKDLAKSIDEQVKEFFDLKKEMELTWKQLHEPFEMSSEYAAWLLINPQSISMTPLRSNGAFVESSVIVTSKPKVVLGEKPTASNPSKLPAFTYMASESDEFTIYLNTEIPFKEAKRISRQNMIGETYEYGKKKVKIEDIDIYGQGNKLVVNTKLSGSYNGNVYFIGKPEYNSTKNKIELENVDFDFSTQKALLKSASWLFKGTLKKRVQENLNFYLQYNMEDTRNMIQKELQNYSLAPGITLNGILDELNISNVYVATDAIKLRIGLKGKLNLDVKGLGQ